MNVLRDATKNILRDEELTAYWKGKKLRHRNVDSRETRGVQKRKRCQHLGGLASSRVNYQQRGFAVHQLPAPETDRPETDWPGSCILRPSCPHKNVHPGGWGRRAQEGGTVVHSSASDSPATLRACLDTIAANLRRLAFPGASARRDRWSNVWHSSPRGPPETLWHWVARELFPSERRIEVDTRRCTSARRKPAKGRKLYQEALTLLLPPVAATFSMSLPFVLLRCCDASL